MGLAGLLGNAFDPGVTAFVPLLMGSALGGLGCNGEVVSTRASHEQCRLIDSSLCSSRGKRSCVCKACRICGWLSSSCVASHRPTGPPSGSVDMDSTGKYNRRVEAPQNLLYCVISVA
ncbi:hypothetical protein DPEC_G00217080 [Dallia pectoralis]|uniref:Uncharacterized protein n=1 Tax=Dallia pectoralis TaxID=75939 RepID=A0ACC2G2W3_DALPE|nr:hypothetical protein DPEC_G00217080 [Dallia pectoralis]